MASSKEYLGFVLDQLSLCGDIAFRPMMGEYVIYCQGKVIGGVYDDRFLVKPTPSAKKLMPNAPLEKPYDGAKEMLSVDNIEDREFLKVLVGSLANELPEPDRKKRPCF